MKKKGVTIICRSVAVIVAVVFAAGCSGGSTELRLGTSETSTTLDVDAGSSDPDPVEIPGEFELNISIFGPGEVTPSSASFPAGTVVELSAAPVPGSSFVGWFGDATGTEKITTVEMSNDLAVIASFTVDLDFTSPIVGLVTPSWSGSDVVVSWRTDEPSVAEVSHGFPGQLDRVVSVEAFKQDHSIVLPGYTIGDEVQFKITTTDAVGNVVETDPDTFVVSSAPVVDVWYGTEREFGQIGIPQQWINIPGNVRDADGIASFDYRLNGGERVAITVGSDGRRLESEGDFNIDIDYHDLQEGANLVELSAVDTVGESTAVPISIVWSTTGASSLPFEANWATAASVTDLAQPVDGLWEIVTGGVRVVDVAYDRVLAFGDESWIDYEAETTVTVRGIDEASFLDEESVGPSVTFLMGWPGHSYTGTQPQWFWYPSGANAAYDWTGPTEGRLLVTGNNNEPADIDESFSLKFDTEYTVRLQAETVTDGVAYRMSMWPTDSTEPSDWNAQIVVADGPATGSFLFVSHHVDAIFGDLTFTPLE